MADVDSTPSTAATTSSSTFNLSAYKESAILLLAFFVPPAAIAVRQGKVDLESRHLALSLALYLSVICYLPAVAHAYWLLYVRDNGGVEEWTGARLRQAQGLWNEHGGVVKAKVDECSSKVIEKYECARSYTTDKMNYASGKKDEVVALVREKTGAVHEFYEDAKEAYTAGTFIDWVKEKMHVVVEKVKTLLESYPRVQAVVHYVEQRVPLVLEFLGKIYETIRAKYQAGAEEGEISEPWWDDSSITCLEIHSRIFALDAVIDDHDNTYSPDGVYKTSEDEGTAVDVSMDGTEDISQKM